MDTKGGRYTIKIGGTRYSGRGKATIKPARAVPKAEANRDGSGYRTVEPKLASVELAFDRGPDDDRIRWTEGMLLDDVDVTFREDDVGVTHYWTKGSWNGEPSLDSDTGEVSGMSVMSDQYRSIAA
ncbi:phage tail tube protein [Methylobacterium fujisawaense]|uniref:phage tail tube protein n=1 Tax=Methylobacterium fujisawaense TaxID=107400 RepID=UPI00313F083A